MYIQQSSAQRSISISSLQSAIQYSGGAREGGQSIVLLWCNAVRREFSVQCEHSSGRGGHGGRGHDLCALCAALGGLLLFVRRRESCRFWAFG